MGGVTKLLITARDPATANDLAEIIPALGLQSGLKISLIAQDPAFTILQNNPMMKDILEVIYMQRMPTADINKLESYINEALESFVPDVLLTGISGPDYGIDEIALKLCHGNEAIKTLSVQSYWGDINPKCDTPADTVFVLDKYASDITRQRYPDINTVITGPLQTRKYDTFDIESARLAFRQKLGLSVETQAIIFFGQPLFEYKWYRDTLDHFAEILAAEHNELLLLYKPHPKETKESIRSSLKRFSACNLESNYSYQSESLKLLAGTDLAVSLFSTINYDLQNLLARTEVPFSVPMYLFYEPQCRNWYKDYCNLDVIPMSNNDMALVVEEPSDLSRMIRCGLDADFKSHCHKNIRRNFYANGKSAMNIVINTLCKYSE